MMLPLWKNCKDAPNIYTKMSQVQLSKSVSRNVSSFHVFPGQNEHWSTEVAFRKRDDEHNKNIQIWNFWIRISQHYRNIIPPQPPNSFLASVQTSSVSLKEMYINHCKPSTPIIHNNTTTSINICNHSFPENSSENLRDFGVKMLVFVDQFPSIFQWTARPDQRIISNVLWQHGDELTVKKM